MLNYRLFVRESIFTMNNFLLFISLLLLFIFILHINSNDITSPSSIFCLGFMLSSFMLFLNTNIWRYDISRFTILLIFSSVLVFFAGCILGNYFRLSFKLRKKISMNIFINELNFQIILLIIVLLCLGLRFLDIYQKTGNLNIFGGAIRAYRYAGDRSTSISMKFCSPLISAISIFSIFTLIENTENNRKKNKLFLPIILLSMIFFLLSSSRIEIIYIYIYALFTYLIISKTKNQKIRFKTIIFIVATVVLLYASFFGAGYLTGKSQVQVSFFDNISVYTGSSIAGLDLWLKDFNYSNEHFGSLIFNGISNIFALFGKKGMFISDPSFRFVNIGSMVHTTNVFTCIAEMLSDVDFFGLYLLLFFEGFFVQRLYNSAQMDYVNNKKMRVSVYIYLVPLLLLSSISERIFMAFLTLSTVIFIFVTMIFINVTMVKKEK